MNFDPTGYTWVREHPYIDSSGSKSNPDCRSDQYDLICQEMEDLRALGVSNVIEVTNHYMGCNLRLMLDLARETGTNVVACTGYYQGVSFPEHVTAYSMEQLVQGMTDEIVIGIDGTELKAGIVAEIGSNEGVITPLEGKVFIAAARAHIETGRPISIHASFSTTRVERLVSLQAYGVNLSRVTIGHCGLKDNLDNVLRMISLDAYVQPDIIGRNSYYPNENRIGMLCEPHNRGLLNRVMLSTGITRHPHLKANGGNGYNYLLTTFIPQLRQLGFSQAGMDTVLRDNSS